MGDKVSVIAEERNVVGKKVAALRRQGLVPGVMYGRDDYPQNIMIENIVLSKAYRAAGKRQPVELQLNGKKHLAMIKSTDLDPVKHLLRHVSFQIVAQNEKVQTELPLVIDAAGETPAEKAGLVVLTTLDSVQVEAFPNDLPDSIHLNGEKLVEEGDHLTVADIEVPRGLTILNEPDQTLVTVYEPGALAAQNAASGGTEEEGAAEGEEAEAAEDQPESAESKAEKEK